MVFVSRGNALSLCFDGRECASFRSPLSREGRAGVKYKVVARTLISKEYWIELPIVLERF